MFWTYAFINGKLCLVLGGRPKVRREPLKLFMVVRIHPAQPNFLRKFGEDEEEGWGKRRAEKREKRKKIS